ncbi:MAG TPA: hypothetical protein VHO03_10285 [Ignavibacteriales bacterium]|nr:hypothetical protein [Ignavibacteriales bacterium]
MKTRHLFILLFFAVFVLPVKYFSQELRFFREKIQIEVKKDECILTGIYYFANKSGITASHNLYYPYIVNDSLPLPYKAEVKDLKSGNKIASISTAKGIIFAVNAASHDTSIVEVKYYQKTPMHMMEYILTTTKEWGTSFDMAEYSVKLPAGYRLLSMQPQFENEKKSNKYRTFFTLKRNYLPQHNFVIKWKEDKNEKATR